MADRRALQREGTPSRRMYMAARAQSPYPGTGPGGDSEASLARRRGLQAVSGNGANRRALWTRMRAGPAHRAEPWAPDLSRRAARRFNKSPCWPRPSLPTARRMLAKKLAAARKHWCCAASSARLLTPRPPHLRREQLGPLPEAFCPSCVSVLPTLKALHVCSLIQITLLINCKFEIAEKRAFNH